MREDSATWSLVNALLVLSYSVGKTVPDKELSTYILRGLPDSWESFMIK